MASVLGDLWQILDKQTYLGQQVLNRYYYRVTSVTGINDSGYAQVADWFVDNIIDIIDVEQHGLLNHYEVEIRNLSNGSISSLYRLMRTAKLVTTHLLRSLVMFQLGSNSYEKVSLLVMGINDLRVL